jgi:hypothetical protein
MCDVQTGQHVVASLEIMSTDRVCHRSRGDAAVSGSERSRDAPRRNGFVDTHSQGRIRRKLAETPSPERGLRNTFSGTHSPVSVFPFAPRLRMPPEHARRNAIAATYLRERTQGNALRGTAFAGTQTPERNRRTHSSQRIRRQTGM